jgi:hypothetical protein
MYSACQTCEQFTRGEGLPRQDRDSIQQFYCDVLGGKVMKADPDRDFIRLGEDFYIAFSN